MSSISDNKCMGSFIRLCSVPAWSRICCCMSRISGEFSSSVVVDELVATVRYDEAVLFDLSVMYESVEAFDARRRYMLSEFWVLVDAALLQRRDS